MQRRRGEGHNGNDKDDNNAAVAPDGEGNERLRR
jgi:hypothetical protein